MASHRDLASPWPRPTPPSSAAKRKRKWDQSTDQVPRLRKIPRQAHEIDQNSDSCGNVGNDVISCWPVASSPGILQNTYTRVIWNTGLPQFSQNKTIDVYLFRGDSDQQVAVWPNVPYSQGHLSVSVNDTWWGERGTNLPPGKNATQTYYFVLVRNGADRLSEPPQETFTATQTALPNSILAAQSSASSVSAASAAASRSASASSASLSSSAVASNGALQNGASNSGPFPKWAIALLSVFGFLALLSVIVVFWIFIRNLRSRKMGHRRNSTGSQSPMMANADPQSPLNAAPSSSAHGEPHLTEAGLVPPPAIRQNILLSDGASTVSRADSAGGPISAVDAAAMAAAFRNVMRKPDFAGRPMEEGESPENEGDMLNRELAEEGRDIRSVSSSRGVKVETLSDSGDAAQ